MKNKFKLTTPILFLIFNRLETTKRVFEEIRKAKPTKLFIAADGPRNEKEKRVTDRVRKWVLSNINWHCKVKTLFREKNLGCKYAVSSAIGWFFENVHQGIILEDDCLPSQSFFRFCQELLEKYKKNKKIKMITGYNLLDNNINLNYSYWFSSNMFIWGWATWRRAWEEYDINIEKKVDIIKLYKLSNNFFDFLLNLKRVNDLKNKKVDTWDYQWSISMKLRKGLCIVPKRNLIENLGFCEQFTNTKPNEIDIKYFYKKRKDLDFPLIHPPKIENNKSLDKRILLLNLKRIFLKKVRRLSFSS